MAYQWTKGDILTHLLQTGEITIARVFECMGDDSKYDEEIKIQNQKINEKNDLQTK